MIKRVFLPVVNSNFLSKGLLVIFTAGHRLTAKINAQKQINTALRLQLTCFTCETLARFLPKFCTVDIKIMDLSIAIAPITPLHPRIMILTHVLPSTTCIACRDGVGLTL